MKKKRILGIDPGTNFMGYGVIDIDGSKYVLVSLGYVDLHKKEGHYNKLLHIHERVMGIIKSFTPDELAIEAPFFGENVQSMLKLGRAQGAAIVAAMMSGLKVYEYSPRKIKLAITGNGNASKEQVAYMLKSIFNIDVLPKKLDATDGLAVAFCHIVNGNGVESTNGKKGKYNSWEDFVEKNKHRTT